MSKAAIRRRGDRVVGDTADNGPQMGFVVQAVQLGGLDKAIDGGCV